MCTIFGVTNEICFFVIPPLLHAAESTPFLAATACSTRYVWVEQGHTGRSFLQRSPGLQVLTFVFISGTRSMNKIKSFEGSSAARGVSFVVVSTLR